jgi:hydrogenase nickel incorporation protein HypB
LHLVPEKRNLSVERYAKQENGFSILRNAPMKTITAIEGKTVDIALEENLLDRNLSLAERNRKHLDKAGVYAVDILGSVGSGKTSLVQQMVKHLKGRLRTAAIAGDLTTTIDADRIQEAGAEVIQINTGKECHLDANLVYRAFSELKLKNVDLLFIENVGNLICPGEFPIGAHERIVVVSTTEGPYMIKKHPYILMDASIVVVNKIDLAEPMEVDIQQLKRDALKVKPAIHVAFTNGRTGQGVPELVQLFRLPKKP